jgi:hypothetical protein
MKTLTGLAAPTRASLQILELVDRIELSTSPLPRECSTTELHEPGDIIPLSGFFFHPQEDDGAGDEI